MKPSGLTFRLVLPTLATTLLTLAVAFTGGPVLAANNAVFEMSARGDSEIAACTAAKDMAGEACPTAAVQGYSTCDCSEREEGDAPLAETDGSYGDNWSCIVIATCQDGDDNSEG